MIKMLKHVCLMVVLALVLSLMALVLPASAASVNGLDFSATPTEGDAPLNVQFSCDYDEGYYSYSWDFGDGNTSSEQCPSHTYQCAGVYDVTLRVSYLATKMGRGIALADNGYVELTKEDYITVYPVADFTASPTMGIAPLTVQFRDQSKGLCSGSWDWSFGDGGSSSAKYPSHTYTQGGTYTVTLTVSGSPSDTVTKLNLIIVEEGEAPPNLVVRDLNITPTYAEPRQDIGITAKVVNEGGAWGSADIQLLINGHFEQSVGVGVAPGTSQPISFTVYKVESGEYQVAITDATGTFYVMEEAPPPSPQAGGLLAGGELDTGGIIAIVVIGIILIGGVVVTILLTRRA